MIKTKKQIAKIARRRKMRKDFEYKHNVNQNRRSETFEIKRDIFGPSRDKNGDLEIDRNGNEILVKLRTRTILQKRKVGLRSVNSQLPMPYPKSRKFAKAKLLIN